MNNKVNYTIVGFIVLIGITMLMGFAYIMLKPSDEMQTKEYLIYFDESVLGLNIDAPVKYRGITVGKVTKLRISPNNSERVEVFIKILKTTPIKEDTVAKLTAQGITGLSYINLSLGTNLAPMLKKKEGEEYPVIKSIPSFFENFEKSLGTVSSRLSTTLEKTSELLNEKNQQQFAILLKQTTDAISRINKIFDDTTISHIHSTAKQIDKFTYDLERLTPQINAFLTASQNWESNTSSSLASIMQSYLGITSSMDEFKRAISDGEFNIKDITKDTIPTLNSTLIELQSTMLRLQETLDKYERSPSVLLFEKEQIKKAPGE